MTSDRRINNHSSQQQQEQQAQQPPHSVCLSASQYSEQLSQAASSAFNHPDLHQGLPQGIAPQLYPDIQRFQHATLPPYGMNLPRIGAMDPRMLFAPPPPNPTLAAAHAAMLAGMTSLPTGVVIPQPQVTPPIDTQSSQDSRPSSARPPSRHPTPPSAQPSPRSVTPLSATHAPPTPSAITVSGLPSPQLMASGRLDLPQPSDRTNLLLQVRNINHYVWTLCSQMSDFGSGPTVLCCKTTDTERLSSKDSPIKLQFSYNRILAATQNQSINLL